MGGPSSPGTAISARSSFASTLAGGTAAKLRPSGARTSTRSQPLMTWRVVITRIGPRVMDTDNVDTAAKGVRDSIAAWCGVDDGDSAWTWEVRGEVARGYAVRVWIEGRDA